MRIAHLILTYTDPLQTERMIRRLYHPDVDFYVHVDKKVNGEAHRFLTRLPNVYLIQNRTNVIWAGYDTVKAILRSCEEILLAGRSYDFIHLMSGQDYPVQKPSVIHRFFEQNKGRQFIRYEHFDNWDGEGYKRINQYHLTNYHMPGRYFVQKLLNAVLPPRKPPALSFYGYSMFWALTPDCIRYVIDYLNTNHAFRRFMKLCWGTDEFIFQTILLNSPFKEQLVNDNLLYYKRPYQSAHPDVLRAKDFAAVINSGKLFARKLNLAVDTTIFDLLDEYIKEDNVKADHYSNTTAD